MRVIRESAAHHFLAILERIKDQQEGWVCLQFEFSKMLSHQDIIHAQPNIKGVLHKARLERKGFEKELFEKFSSELKGFVYIFPDNDILMLLQARSPAEKNRILEQFKNFTEKVPKGLYRAGQIQGHFYGYHKLAEHKVFIERRYDAYHAMSDTYRVSSIPLRRARAQDPKVLVVEDDRFTASFTSSMLHIDYEVFICRSGEEAIMTYIKEAPDIVLLDVHLPGLNGHETLQAIRSIDPEAYIVMLSVDSGRSTIINAAKRGANNFLKKPFSQKRLVTAVRSSPHIRPMPAEKVEANVFV